MKVKQLFPILACPQCHSSLESFDQLLKCRSCDLDFAVIDSVDFLGKEVSFDSDDLDNLKTLIKKFPRFYMFLSEVISPVYISKSRLKRIIKEIDTRGLIGLNIGSGVTNYSENIINFDLQQFKNVEVLGDLYQLPFKDDTFDYVFSIYVLEHVPDTRKAIDEMYRVLKPGGKAYCLIPFIQGFHAAPSDFSRLTISGINFQFAEFNDLETQGLGPTSALLWIFQEWLALLLSFGHKRLGTAIHIFVMTFSFPLKYLDILLSRFPSSEKIACATEVVATKPR